MRAREYRKCVARVARHVPGGDGYLLRWMVLLTVLSLMVISTEYSA